MATKFLCAVSDCDKPASKREWCHKHYRRWLIHGDPLGGGKFRPPAGAAVEAIEEALREAVPDQCWKWPYSENGKGYGQLWIAGTHVTAHRAVCIRAHGEPPSPKHEAAHNCGKGHEACINPHHLEWKTRLENDRDKIIHGTTTRGERNAASKLNDAEVAAIRFCYEFSGVSQHKLAKYFGVQQTAISKIVNWRHWALADGRRN